MEGLTAGTLGLIMIVVLFLTLFSMHSRLTQIHADFLRIARLLGDPKTVQGKWLWSKPEPLEDFANVNGTLLKIVKLLEKEKEGEG